MSDLFEEYLDCIVTAAAIICAVTAFSDFVNKIIAYL